MQITFLDQPYTDDASFALGFLLFATVTGLLVVTFWLLRHGQGKRAAPAVPVPVDAGTLQAPQSGTVYAVDAGGSQLQFCYTNGGRTKAGTELPGELAVQLACAASGQFEVAKEEDSHRFWKQVGLTVEIQTGEADFDRDFYLESDSVPGTQAAFSLPGVRSALRAVFATGCQRVKLEAGQLCAIRKPYEPARDANDLWVGRVAGPLAALATALPMPVDEPRRLGLPAWELRRRLLWGLAFGCFWLSGGPLLAIIMMRAYPVVEGTRFLLSAAGAAGLLLVSFIGLAFWLVRGRSSSHRDFVPCLVLAGLGLPGMTIGLAHGLNAWLNTAPATTQTLRVVATSSEPKLKRGYHYFMHVEPWRPGPSTTRFLVSENFQAQLRPGVSRVVLLTQPGALGFQQLLRVEMAQP